MRKQRENIAGGLSNQRRKINENQINKLINDNRLSDYEKMDAVKRHAN
jgi:hypothetical protein